MHNSSIFIDRSRAERNSPVGITPSCVVSLGDTVTLDAMAVERFGVRVDTIEGDVMTGVVQAERLLYTNLHRLRPGDIVCFSSSHVLGVRAG